MDSKRSIRRGRRQAGSVVVLSAIFMVVLLGFGALSIDVGHYYQLHQDLQSATDAAALAGALIITNQNAGSVTSYATAVALTNGIDTSQPGTILTIQVGQWGTNALGVGTFSNGATPYNAVSVYAQKQMPVTLAKAVGASAMTPWAQSVAALASAGSAFGGTNGLVPFGVDTNQANNAFYTPYWIHKGDVGSPGNFGELDFSGIDENGLDWATDMTSGCNCTVSIGQQVPVTTGKNGKCADCIGTGLIDRLDAYPFAVLPVVGSWPNGNSGDATIVGFMGVEILSVTNGGNWSVELENVPVTLGGSGGGVSTNAPFAIARVLVQ